MFVFVFMLMGHSPDFTETSPTFFLLRDNGSGSCVALVEELGSSRWYMLVVVFSIMHLYNFLIYLLLLQSIKKKNVLNLLLISYMEWLPCMFF